ncbi:ABC transporter ATP-binding protein [Mycobacterium sp. NPDC003323]
MTGITINGLGKRFGTHVALRDVDIDLPGGAFLVLLGPSGCGKTTTLRILAGLEQAGSGVIRVGERTVVDVENGIEVPADKRGLGMVFQSYALWPHMTVRGNIDWPLRVAGWKRAEREQRIEEVLAALEIGDLAERQPAQISGGQQQRVAIARTIAPRPAVLLFDEPLSNLDARLRVETRAEIVRMHRMTQATSVYVTHDQTEALAMATHIAVMNGGVVEQFGTPDELLNRPATAFVAAFLGTPPAVLLGGAVIDGLAPGWQAMYRPEDLALQDEAAVAFEVLESIPMAGRYLVTGKVGADRVAVVSDRPAQPGHRTGLVLPGAPAAVFDETGHRR